MPYKCCHCNEEITRLNAYCDVRIEGDFSFETEQTETNEDDARSRIRHIDDSDWTYTCPECSEDIYDPNDCLVEEEEDDEEEEEPVVEEPDLIGNDRVRPSSVTNNDKTKNTPSNITFCACGALFLANTSSETRCPNCYA